MEVLDVDVDVEIPHEFVEREMRRLLNRCNVVGNGERM